MNYARKFLGVNLKAVYVRVFDQTAIHIAIEVKIHANILIQ